jgi:hypothetical protein
MMAQTMRQADRTEDGIKIWEVACGEVWRDENGLWYFGNGSDACVIESWDACERINADVQ